MRVKKTVASFMIYLVLTLLIIIPMQTSAFTAQVTGAKGVPGVRAVDDVTLVNASAASPVSLLRGQQAYPLDCILELTGYECSHAFEQATLSPGEHTLTFRQENATPTELDKTFLVDGQAPSIISFNLTPVKGALLVSYVITDTAVIGGLHGCAGIKHVSITSESQTLLEKNYTQRPCQIADSITLPGEGLSGEYRFYLSARDMLDQSTLHESQTLILDLSTPQIAEDYTVKLGNRTITGFSTHPQLAPFVDVIVDIKEANLSTVQLNLSAFTRDPLLSFEYANVTANCQAFGERNICLASDIQFNPGTALVHLGVTARDGAGNTAFSTINKTFELIDTSGEVIYFDPIADQCDDEGNCYVSQGTVTYSIVVEGADAGLAPQLITLAVSELADFLPTVRAASCNQTMSDSWESAECLAYVPVLAQTDNLRRKVVLTRPTTDALGTPLVGKLTSTVTIDNQAPLNTTRLFLSQACPVAGETASLIVNVTDSTSPELYISAYAENITENTRFKGTCTPQTADLFSCKLSLENFVSYPEQENVSVIVRDLAGNELLLNVNVEVCQSESEIEPEFITSIDTPRTFEIDRRIASQMPIKLYIPLDFSLKSSVAEKITFLDLETDDCAGTELRGGQPYILGEFDFLDTQGVRSQRGQPILVVPFGGLGVDIDIPDKTSVNCTIQVYEKKGSLRFTKPEQQQFSVEVIAKNNELGTIEDATTAKLASMLAELNSLQETIDARMKYHKWLKTICDIAGYLTMVADTLGMVESAVYLVMVVAYAVASIGGGGEAINKAWLSVCKALHGFISFVEKIWPQGKLSTGVGMFIKMGCIIYNCGVCSPGGIASMVQIGVSGVSAMSEGGLTGSASTNEESSTSTSTSSTQESSSTSTSERSTREETGDDSGESLTTSSSSFDSSQVQTDIFLSEARARLQAGEGWIIDPYSNIHYAKTCLCNPGIIYNYNKKQQLLCRQYKCVQDTAAQGLSTTICDAAYDMGTCLYYDGAITKRSFIDEVQDALINFVITSGPYIAYEATCAETADSCNAIQADAKVVLCDLIGSALSLSDFEDVLKNPYASGPLEPEGPDFCEGIPLGEQPT